MFNEIINNDLKMFHKGQKVKVRKEVNRQLYMNYADWVGEVIDDYGNIVVTQTLVPYANSDYTGVVNWKPECLELINNEVNINIPDNHIMCSKCKQLSCQGMDRLECILHP